MPPGVATVSCLRKYAVRTSWVVRMCSSWVGFLGDMERASRIGSPSLSLTGLKLICEIMLVINDEERGYQQC